jgi:uncharacterized protein (TIGR02145 family)
MRILCLFCVLTLFAVGAFAQTPPVRLMAVMSTESDGASPEGSAGLNQTALNYITELLRGSALATLPASQYQILTSQSVLQLLGEDQAAKLCAEASCLVELGRTIAVDYIAQATVGSSGGELILIVEIYNVRTAARVGGLTVRAPKEAGLYSELEAQAPEMFTAFLAADGKTVASGASMTDPRDQQVYKTIQMGDRLWMASNLNYNSKDSYCVGENEAGCKRYGRLYSFDASAFACPEGWALPDQADWEALAEIPASELKERQGWNGVMGGFRAHNGAYASEGASGYWWSASGAWNNFAQAWILSSSMRKMQRYTAPKTNAYSIRCVKN